MDNFNPRPADALFPEAKRVNAVKDRLCIRPPLGCGKAIGTFRDSMSEKEYGITGMCQSCQDEVWGV